MKNDRGIIKWQPFDSVISSKQVIQSLLYEKEKQPIPVLSEEEIKDIEEKIITAYYSQETITLEFYKNGYIKKLTGKIKKIDQITKIVYLDNNKLFFKQILTISN